MNLSIYLVIPLMVILVVLQVSLLPHFPVIGTVPQLWFLATLAWGFQYGLRAGMIWAFVAGLLVDLFSAGPMGVTTLALMSAVAFALLIQRNFPQSRVIMPVLLTVLATMVFWFVYLLLLRLIMPLIINNQPFLGVADLAGSARAPGLIDDVSRGYGLSRQMLAFVVRTALLNGLLMLPIYWGLSYLEKMIRPRGVEI